MPFISFYKLCQNRHVLDNKIEQGKTALQCMMRELIMHLLLLCLKKCLIFYFFYATNQSGEIYWSPRSCLVCDLSHVCSVMLSLYQWWNDQWWNTSSLSSEDFLFLNLYLLIYLCNEIKVDTKNLTKLRIGAGLSLLNLRSARSAQNMKCLHARKSFNNSVWTQIEIEVSINLF